MPDDEKPQEPGAPAPEVKDEEKGKSLADVIAAARKQISETPAAAPAAEAEPATPEEPAGEPAPAEVEEEKKPEGEGEGEGAPEGEGEQAPELVVEIPGRRPGEDPIAVAFDDKETADLVRGAIRGGLRRDELARAKADVERRLGEVEQVEQLLQLDPTGFIADRIRPELRKDIALHLLSIPEVFEQVAPEIEGWADEDVRARRQAEMQRDRTLARETTSREVQRLEAARQTGRLVRETVDALVPGDFADDDAAMFREDCLSDVVRYCRANPRVASLRAPEVVAILEQRLRHYGIDPEQAQAALSSGQPLPRPAASRRTPAGARGTPEVDEARTAGAKLKQAGAARRAAAAVPGAGAGGQPTKLAPPAQQGVKERISWLRGKLLPS